MAPSSSASAVPGESVALFRSNTSMVFQCPYLTTENTPSSGAVHYPNINGAGIGGACERGTKATQRKAQPAEYG